MPILFVRHGAAGRRSGYKGDDRFRPLSKRGVAQARALVPLLAEHRPQRILSSPYVRCCETVQPTAEALGLPVESIEELAEGHGEETLRLMERMVGEAAVLCSHGDVATAVLVALTADAAGAADAADAADAGHGPPPRRLQKGEVWVIQSVGGRLAITAHLRPTTTESNPDG
jgi:8-oxo-dGTP diphosphatase